MAIPGGSDGAVYRWGIDWNLAWVLAGSCCAPIHAIPDQCSNLGSRHWICLVNLDWNFLWNLSGEEGGGVGSNRSPAPRIVLPFPQCMAFIQKIALSISTSSDFVP